MATQTFKNWVGSSKQVVSTQYNEERKVMTVEFIKGAKYEYSEVPLKVWEKSLVTESIGKFINTDIKPHYSYKKIA